MLKKDNAGAREAIRWLEAEFRKGSRLVQSFVITKSYYQVWNLLAGIHETSSAVCPSVCHVRMVAIFASGAGELFVANWHRKMPNVFHGCHHRTS